jgi:hypothetical protein
MADIAKDTQSLDKSVDETVVEGEKARLTEAVAQTGVLAAAVDAERTGQDAGGATIDGDQSADQVADEDLVQPLDPAESAEHQAALEAEIQRQIAEIDKIKKDEEFAARNADRLQGEADLYYKDHEFHSEMMRRRDEIAQRRAEAPAVVTSHAEQVRRSEVAMVLATKPSPTSDRAPSQRRPDQPPVANSASPAPRPRTAPSAAARTPATAKPADSTWRDRLRSVSSMFRSAPPPPSPAATKPVSAKTVAPAVPTAAPRTTPVEAAEDKQRHLSGASVPIPELSERIRADKAMGDRITYDSRKWRSEASRLTSLRETQEAQIIVLKSLLFNAHTPDGAAAIKAQATLITAAQQTRTATQTNRPINNNNYSRPQQDLRLAASGGRSVSR